jgi:hypothetical protein
MPTQLKSGEHAAQIERQYQAALEAAAITFERVVQQALGRYTRETTAAANHLERALRTSDDIWQAIMVPAQAAYDRQVKLADDAIAKVLGPAHTQYTAATVAAEAAWQEVYPEALRVYQQHVQAANQLKHAETRAAKA